MYQPRQERWNARHFSAWVLAVGVVAASCLLLALAAHQMPNGAAARASADLSAPAPLILPAADHACSTAGYGNASAPARRETLAHSRIIRQCDSPRGRQINPATTVCALYRRPPPNSSISSAIV